MARPGLMTHPKFRRLVHQLGVPVPHALGYLECMWSVCYERGDALLGDALDVELAAQWPGEKGALCRALLECRFIDQAEHDRYEVHDLFDHAPEYVRKRKEREHTRKHKYRHRNRPLSAGWRNGDGNGHHDGELGGRCPPNSDGRQPLADLGLPPPPPPINTPPTPPSGGKGKKRKNADPEREAAAQRVVDHYQDVVAPAHIKARGVKNVCTLLGQGLTEEQLRNAADGYAAFCRRKNKGSQYRHAVGNFYGEAAGYQEYLDYQPGAAPSLNGTGNHDAEAQMWARREQAKRDEEEAKKSGGLQALMARVRPPLGEGGAA